MTLFGFPNISAAGADRDRRVRKVFNASGGGIFSKKEQRMAPW